VSQAGARGSKGGDRVPALHLPLFSSLSPSLSFSLSLSFSACVPWRVTSAIVMATCPRTCRQDVEKPIHLLMDLGLGERRMSCKAYVSVGLALGSTKLGTVFEDIKLQVINSESDQIGIDTLLKVSAEGGASAAGAGEKSDVDNVELTVKKLLRTLEGVMEHVSGTAFECSCHLRQCRL
jgi:hypothetical protein